MKTTNPSGVLYCFAVALLIGGCETTKNSGDPLNVRLPAHIEPDYRLYQTELLIDDITEFYRLSKLNVNEVVDYLRDYHGIKIIIFDHTTPEIGENPDFELFTRSREQWAKREYMEPQFTKLLGEKFLAVYLRPFEYVSLEQVGKRPYYDKPVFLLSRSVNVPILMHTFGQYLIDYSYGTLPTISEEDEFPVTWDTVLQITGNQRLETANEKFRQQTLDDEFFESLFQSLAIEMRAHADKTYKKLDLYAFLYEQGKLFDFSNTEQDALVKAFSRSALRSLDKLKEIAEYQYRTVVNLLAGAPSPRAQRLINDINETESELRLVLTQILLEPKNWLYTQLNTSQ